MRLPFGVLLCPRINYYCVSYLKKAYGCSNQISAVLVSALLVCFLTAAVFSQDTVTGAFQGDVTDKFNVPIAGATVEITNQQTLEVRIQTTNSKGVFFQGLLSPGLYEIKVSRQGFKPQVLQREISVSVSGEIVPVPVTLEPETTPSTQPPVVDPPANIRTVIRTTDSRQDNSVKNDPLVNLPIGGTTVTRSFDELALLSPGVAPPPQTIGDVAGPGVGPGVGSAGQFAVNGMRSRGNNFTVDGSDNNDEDIGVRRQGFVALVPQPIESIQEFNIITLLAPAQFGRNMGAQVNAVSKEGGNKVRGSLYGMFNSSQLNARNYFDTTNGTNSSPLRSAANQPVTLDGQPLNVRNESGGEDSFTAGQAGGAVGGAFVPKKLFYFFSGEYQKINATQEKSFAVPSVEQRGAFGTGASGINRDILNSQSTAGSLSLYPLNERSAAIFSLFPYANNPTGIYGANTLTKVLPASGRGTILSGRLDDKFAIGSKQQSFTARYNFTDDKKNIPAVNDAIYSTVLSKIRTHNISLFFNSELAGSGSGSHLFNQVRLSFGRTKLGFSEVRDQALLPSFAAPGTPFLLNAPLRFNRTLPLAGGGAPSTVALTSTIPGIAGLPSVESTVGPLGEVIIGGFSPIGVDVFNFPQDRVNNTYQVADELTWSRSGHRVVGGVDFRRTDLDSDLPRLARPLVTFNGTPKLSQRITTCPNGGTGNFCFPAANDPLKVIKPEDILGAGATSNFQLTYFVGRPDAKANLRYYQLNFYGQDTWRASNELSISFGLRYEYNTPVKERSRLIESTFTDPLLQNTYVNGLNTFIDGRTNLYEPDKNNFAPRVGIAYSPHLFGANKVSVIRAGFGVFYDQILGSVVSQSRNVFPTYLTVNFGGSPNNTGVPEITNIFNPARPSLTTLASLIRPGTVNIFNAPPSNYASLLTDLRFFFPRAVTSTLPNRFLEMPRATHFSFSFEQQLNANLTASASYVGTRGRQLLRFSTPNNGPSLTVSPTSIGTGGAQFFPGVTAVVRVPDRPVASINAVNMFESTASSEYDALQLQLRSRFLNRFSLNVAYTFSKVNDDVSDVFDLAGAYALPQNSFNLGAEHGPANFDVRNRLTYELIYSFGKRENSGLGNRLSDSLRIAATGRISSGQPFTVNSTIDVNLDGNLTDRLNSVSGLDITGDRSQPLRLSTSNTLSLLAPFGTDGQIGRNSFRSGGIVELDLSVIKPFHIGSKNLQFRTDIFNFINRANFGIPVRQFEAVGFGRSTRTVTPGRRIQFSLKYEF